MLESVICTCQRLSELNKTIRFLLLIFHRVSRRGDLVAQSETLCSWKAKLSTAEHGHYMDGFILHARLCACQDFSGAKFCSLYKRFFG